MEFYAIRASTTTAVVWLRVKDSRAGIMLVSALCRSMIERREMWGGELGGRLSCIVQYSTARRRQSRLDCSIVWGYCNDTVWILVSGLGAWGLSSSGAQVGCRL